MLVHLDGDSENSGATQPVQLGIRARTSNRYSLSHWKLNKDVSGICLILAFPGLNLSIWASECSDQGPGRVGLGEEAPVGAQRT